jgi:hypothetical protein
VQPRAQWHLPVSIVAGVVPRNSVGTIRVPVQPQRGPKSSQTWLVWVFWIVKRAHKILRIRFVVGARVHRVISAWPQPICLWFVAATRVCVRERGCVSVSVFVFVWVFFLGGGGGGGGVGFFLGKKLA